MQLMSHRCRRIHRGLWLCRITQPSLACCCRCSRNTSTWGPTWLEENSNPLSEPVLCAWRSMLTPRGINIYQTDPEFLQLTLCAHTLPAISFWGGTGAASRTHAVPAKQCQLDSPELSQRGGVQCSFNQGLQGTFLTLSFS